MKIKIIMILIITNIICCVWLLGENRTTNRENNELVKEINHLKHERDTLADQYVELLEDYGRCFDEALRLEEENQILGSLVASENNLTMQ